MKHGKHKTKKRLKEVERIAAGLALKIDDLEAEAIERTHDLAAARDWRRIADEESERRGLDVERLNASLRVVLRTLGTRTEPSASAVAKARRVCREALDG